MFIVRSVDISEAEKLPVVAILETLYPWPASVTTRKIKEAVCIVNSYMDVCSNNTQNLQILFVHNTAYFVVHYKMKLLTGN
jgi:hypothetical protein